MKKETRTDALLRVLSDHEWHDTDELAKKVGHTFGSAKFRLVSYRHHYSIETRRHPTKKRQWQYQLVD